MAESAADEMLRYTFCYVKNESMLYFQTSYRETQDGRKNRWRDGKIHMIR